MSVTLADVAAKAGVSTMTVSNVLTGKSGKVSEATAQRVLAAVEETGYVVNASARALSANSSRIVAIVIAGGSPILRGTHDARVVGHITSELQRHGYAAMLIASQDINKTIKSLRSWQVDGAIFLNTLAHDIETFRKRQSTPLVFVDTYDDRPGILTVRTDDYGGGRLAAQHLINFGHTTNAIFVGPLRGYKGVVDERYRGFKDVYEEYGLTTPEAPFDFASTDVESGISLATQVMALPSLPSAIFCSADDLAVGLMSGLKALGVAIPEDVSVIGFDGFDISLTTTPQLTTIGQDMEAKAKRAVSALLSTKHRAFGELITPESTEVALPVTLIDRDTVAKRSTHQADQDKPSI